MPIDLYVWAAPRHVDATAAAELVESWQAGGADPARAPFEPSVDVAWFLRELAKDEPTLELSSDVPPSPTRTPIWLAPDDPPAVRYVGIELPPERARDVANLVFGLATKYDLVVYDPIHDQLDHPLEALSEYASATFWPGGAIRAAIAGGGGLIVAIVAWQLGIPILSGILAVVGAFLFVMAVVTFAHEIRVRARHDGA
jgi:hypothetical protein